MSFDNFPKMQIIYIFQIEIKIKLISTNTICSSIEKINDHINNPYDRNHIPGFYPTSRKFSLIAVNC